MCDIKKISKEKDELIKDMEEVSILSGANIIQVEEDMKEIEDRARKNIQKLSLLL